MSHSVMVSTTDFDSVSPSSNLGGTTTKHGGCSSVGRAEDCGSFGHGFESHTHCLFVFFLLLIVSNLMGI